MPELANARHERFAQLIASGLDQDEAYEKAGFKPDRGHASRLAANGIKVRVAEILQEIAETTKIDAIVVTKNLLEIAAEARALKSDYGPSALSVARASWMDAAKLNGLIVEKTEGSLNLSVCRSLLELAGD